MNQPPETSTPFSLPSIQLTWWRILLLVGLGLLTLGALIVFGGGRTALTALTTVDLRWIGLGMVIHYSGFVVRGLRWQQLLRASGHRLRWRYVTALLLSGWFVSALLPARAGDLLRIAMLRSPTANRQPSPHPYR